MYTKEHIETALKEFERIGSVQATITLLGYPSSSSLYKWYERKLEMCIRDRYKRAYIILIGTVKFLLH